MFCGSFVITKSKPRNSIFFLVGVLRDKFYSISLTDNHDLPTIEISLNKDGK